VTITKPATILFPIRVLAELRRVAARETLLTGERVTVSSFVRRLVSENLRLWNRCPPSVG
jgi:hypothetical protein